MPILMLSTLLLTAMDRTGDQTAGLQREISRCRPGGVVSLAAGTYPVSTLQLKPDCTYRGQPGLTTLKLTAKDAFIFDLSERSKIEISGITFDGNRLGGAIVAKGYGPVRDIRIENCTFKNVVAAAAYPANLTILSSWGFIDSAIAHNRFTDVSGGIWLTAVQNVSISGNVFTNVTQSDAIFIAPNPVSFPSGDNLTIANNTIDGVAKIGIEIFLPYPPNGSRLDRPVIENNKVSRLTASDGEGMGLSITEGEGAIIRNNTVDNTSGTPQQNGIGIEVIVRNAKVIHNTISNGVGYGIAVQGTPGADIEFNTITGARVDGIKFSCDNGRERCNSSRTVIENNTIANAHLYGIHFDNNWSQSRVMNNVITRAGGAWPDDSRVSFTGIKAPPPPEPSEIGANTIKQTSPAPAGFRFRAIDSGR